MNQKLALRLLQGIAGAAGVVIARAVVSDIARGHRAAQMYSVLSLITSLAPVLASSRKNGFSA